MIELDHVSKAYNGRPVVDDLSLSVPEGAFCVVLGPSGCSKSTSLRMINRLVPFDSGVIRIAGEDIRAVPPEALRRRIGYAIQSIGLFPHWPVEDNIATVPRLLNWPRARIRIRLDFDGIEVYNGYDLERPERVEQVLRDYWALLDFGWRYVATGSSDSHRIQFHWAGYPRTMVTMDPNATVESGDTQVDPLAVVASIKKGHATVTSGPIIEFVLGGVHPGDEILSTDESIRGHLRVRAAPWIDVASVAA